MRTSKFGALNRARAAPFFASLAILISSTVSAHGTDFGFEQILIQPGLFTGEPAVLVTPGPGPDEILVSAPTPYRSLIWRSGDGGSAFDALSSPAGGSGDVDLVRAGNRLFAIDLRNSIGETTLPLSASSDNGVTFQLVRELSTECCRLDRPWLAAMPSGDLLATAVDSTEQQIHSWLIDDSGGTRVGIVADGVLVAGKPIVAGDRAYVPYVDMDKRLRLASSDDGIAWSHSTIWNFRGGRSTSIPKMDPGDPGYASNLFIFPALAVDDAGTLYATWSTSQARSVSEAASSIVPGIFISTSQDRGAAWSTPQLVSDPARTSILPWLVAGAEGRVGIAYIDAASKIDHNLATSDTTWDLVLAFSPDASSGLGWSRTTVAQAFHSGSVCTEGAMCFGPQRGLIGMGNLATPHDRRLLDFFQIGADDAGVLYMTYVRDVPGDPGDPGSLLAPVVDVMLARQTSGPRLR